MQYTENIPGIKINVQAVDITISDDVKDTIRKCISRLSRFHDKIEWADVYLEDKKEKSTQQKQVSIRLGLPGNDPFASEYGDNFHALLTDVENKLRSQLEKFKSNFQISCQTSN
ncbi:MAG: ribosome-associated translation inhibitor RaiA [Aequorivita vladivostokensis]|nr:ribosome-associated translation inhibitor RaiA [Aequorivita vladivostokensis]